MIPIKEKYSAMQTFIWTNSHQPILTIRATPVDWKGVLDPGQEQFLAPQANLPCPAVYMAKGAAHEKTLKKHSDPMG